MTDEEIETTASGPSTHWIESGSGNLGRLYVELIKADKLPNMDAATLNIRDKTDAFACMVFEDCIVNTDVVTDSLSPRWMPWCRRAFVFNISHPSSDLLIGIFDHDPEASPLQTVARLASSGVHDSIGRLVVNVARFRQDTVYNLTVRMQYFLENQEPSIVLILGPLIHSILFTMVRLWKGARRLQALLRFGCVWNGTTQGNHF